MDESRRRTLRWCGLCLVGATAGCVSGGSGGDGDGGDPTATATPTETETETDTETATATPTTTEKTITVEPTTEDVTGGESIERSQLPENGADQYVDRVETFESQGTDHVSEGTDIDYERIPPTSGPHYTSTVDAGFYDQRQPLGALVHTLEHGAVVVYYDPEALTDDARESLRAFAEEHTDTWAQVVVVPAPTDDPPAPYVLTAWRKRLQLKQYDAKAVRAFLAEYLGRGPENPVR